MVTFFLYRSLSISDKSIFTDSYRKFSIDDYIDCTGPAKSHLHIF